MTGRTDRFDPNVRWERGTGHYPRVAGQRAHTAELDRIRLERPLTADEQAEADRLANRLYMQVWRAQLREQAGAAR